MTGLLFVNAPEATHKQVNKMLVYLNDWEYGNYHAFKFVSTKNAYDLDLPSDAKEGQDLDGSVPPLDPDFRNAWAGAHLSDIEAFCRDLERNGVNGVNPELYILVDSAGLHQKTCVLGMRVEEGWNAERKTMYYSEHFRRFRMPWDEAYLTWCKACSKLLPLQAHLLIYEPV